LGGLEQGCSCWTRSSTRGESETLDQGRWMERRLTTCELDEPLAGRVGTDRRQCPDASTANELVARGANLDERWHGLACPQPTERFSGTAPLLAMLRDG